MKRETMLRAPEAGEPDGGCRTAISVEAILYREIAELCDWVVAQGLDVGDDRAHANEGSRDRLYWRYGYLVGLQRALAMFTNGGATVH
jgi:hypothetical protein